MGLAGHLVSGFLTALAAALLTHWLGERRRADPLTISVRLKQLEVAATLYARFSALMGRFNDYASVVKSAGERMQLIPEIRRLGVELQEYYGVAYVYLPNSIAQDFEILLQHCDQVQDKINLMGYNPTSLSQYDVDLKQIRIREPLFYQAIRDEFDIDGLVSPMRRRRSSSKQSAQPISMPPPEWAG